MNIVRERLALKLSENLTCLKYGHYQYLPHCLEIQAECAHFMGDDKKSADLYRKCYYLCQVIEYQEGLEITKKEAKEYLGMEFET